MNLPPAPAHLFEKLPPRPVVGEPYFDRDKGEWITPALSAEDQALTDEIDAKLAERAAYNEAVMAAFRAQA